MSFLSNYLQGNYDPKNILLDKMAPQVRGNMPAWAKMGLNLASNSSFSVSNKRGWMGVNGQDLPQPGGSSALLAALLDRNGEQPTMRNAAADSPPPPPPAARRAAPSRYDEWGTMPISLGAARRLSNL